MWKTELFFWGGGGGGGGGPNIKKASDLSRQLPKLIAFYISPKGYYWQIWVWFNCPCSWECSKLARPLRWLCGLHNIHIRKSIRFHNGNGGIRILAWNWSETNDFMILFVPWFVCYKWIHQVIWHLSINGFRCKAIAWAKDDTVQ